MLESVSLTQEAKMDTPSKVNIGPGKALEAGAACQFFLNFQRLSFYGHSGRGGKSFSVLRLKARKYFEEESNETKVKEGSARISKLFDCEQASPCTS